MIELINPMISRKNIEKVYRYILGKNVDLTAYYSA